MFLYETHCHEKLCSACAVATPEELVMGYKNAGYSGLVLTDHFLSGNTCVSYRLTYKERVLKYYDAFLKAKELGEKLDFDVIFGFEHMYGGWKEMLVYGLEIDFLQSNDDLLNLSAEEFYKRVNNSGGIIIHAHPYRYRWYIDMDFKPRFDLCDGVEVYNAYNTKEENVKAFKSCKEWGKIALSGGDIHDGFDKKLNYSGVYFDKRVRTAKEFANELTSKNYDLRIHKNRVKQLNESVF